MKREEMVCSNCVNYTSGRCYADPQPIDVDSGHHCDRGRWYRWDKGYQEWVPYFWGEWEREPEIPCEGKDCCYTR